MDMSEDMIAPCGLNCAVCMAHLRKKNQCVGCRARSAPKQLRCVLSACEEHGGEGYQNCFECGRRPCPRLKKLAKRYKERYAVDLLGNLSRIEAEGIGAFVQSEKQKWVCAGCGATLSMHRPGCLSCGRLYR